MPPTVTFPSRERLVSTGMCTDRLHTMASCFPMTSTGIPPFSSLPVANRHTPRTFPSCLLFAQRNAGWDYDRQPDNLLYPFLHFNSFICLSYRALGPTAVPLYALLLAQVASSLAQSLHTNPLPLLLLHRF